MVGNNIVELPPEMGELTLLRYDPLSSYTLAIRCPVLLYRRFIRIRYQMYGTAVCKTRYHMLLGLC